MSEGFNKKGLCKLCHEPRTINGHDPCIANLPGVVYACCGHGITSGYIKFNDGRRLRFHPIDMVLDVAQHEVVPKTVPVYTKGEPYRVLKFKTGKTKGEVGRYSVIETKMEGSPVKIKKRNI